MQQHLPVQQTPVPKWWQRETSQRRLWF